PVDPQRSIFYATVRNSAVTGSPGQPLKSDRESRLSVCQPILWLQDVASRQSTPASQSGLMNIETRYRYNPDVKSLPAIVPAVI
ncbi:hypothetical protein, partial [Escherichia coli]|uniref:hypothetical protein n=1 Tax=Escherichia coli TaxID=562 RepID=UPI0013B0326A